MEAAGSWAEVAVLVSAIIGQTIVGVSYLVGVKFEVKKASKDIDEIKKDVKGLAETKVEIATAARDLSALTHRVVAIERAIEKLFDRNGHP